MIFLKVWIPVCGTSPCPESVTVTLQLPLLVLSTVDVAVIVALPTLTAVTTPLLTVATLSSLEIQVTV